MELYLVNLLYEKRYIQETMEEMNCSMDTAIQISRNITLVNIEQSIQEFREEFTKERKNKC